MQFLKDKKVFKYLFIGFTAFFVDYCLFIFLNELTHLPIFYSNMIALLTGFLISFFGNRILVFGSDKTSRMKHGIYKQIFFYIVLLAINTVLSYLIIKSLQSINIDAAIGKIISMVFIVAWNYILYKKIIFKQV